MDRGAWWATGHGIPNSQTQMREKEQQVEYIQYIQVPAYIHLSFFTKG